jgi:hypothetical protein
MFRFSVAAFYAFAKPFFYRRRPFHDGGLKVRLLPPHFHPQLETIVYRISEVLLAAEIRSVVCTNACPSKN